MNSCAYFQAYVRPQECWFFVGVLRSYEYVCFDRTYDVEGSIFEFFVPHEYEEQFIAVMSYFAQKEVVESIQKLPNRLLNAQEQV
jgi:hypothetical protein